MCQCKNPGSYPARAGNEKNRVHRSRKRQLVFLPDVTFSEKKLYRNFEISFSVTIPKNGDDIRIDVLDEAFCQPYDYQRILHDHPDHKTAFIVQNEVEKWMYYLQEKGVLSGHIRGEYI